MTAKRRIRDRGEPELDFESQPLFSVYSITAKLMPSHKAAGSWGCARASSATKARAVYSELFPGRVIIECKKTGTGKPYHIAKHLMHAVELRHAFDEVMDFVLHEDTPMNPASKRIIRSR